MSCIIYNSKQFLLNFKIFEINNLNKLHLSFSCISYSCYFITDAENQIVLTTCYGETTDTFLADMVIYKVFLEIKHV